MNEPETGGGGARAGGARRFGGALEKAYQFTLWLVPTVEKFPKSQRFLLGDRIQNTAIDVLEGLIEATYSREAVGILTQVNLRLEKLRFFFRAAKDLRFIDLRRYEYAARAIDEIGRLVGGWIKAGRGASAQPAV